LEILSHHPVDALPSYNGPTWLDRELMADRPEPLRDAGFEGGSGVAATPAPVVARPSASEGAGRHHCLSTRRPGNAAAPRVGWRGGPAEPRVRYGG
jgi:hypothetical protein